MIVQISAGQGPEECQIAVGKTEERSQYMNKQKGAVGK